MSDPMPGEHEVWQIAEIFESTLEGILEQSHHAFLCNLMATRAALKAGVLAAALSTQAHRFEVLGLRRQCCNATRDFIECAVDAFFDNDLLHATNVFLRKAKGSFGLTVTSSLESDREMVIAARGQSMSVAFFPECGLVLFASEQAAVKAALPLESSLIAKLPSGRVRHGSGCYRVDLDSLSGELIRLTWCTRETSAPGPAPSMSRQSQGYSTLPIMQCGAYALQATTVCYIEEAFQPSWNQRQVPLYGNPLVLPIPATTADPVGNDIAEIPEALHRIQ
eukprot:gene25747-31497_t